MIRTTDGDVLTSANGSPDTRGMSAAACTRKVDLRPEARVCTTLVTALMLREAEDRNPPRRPLELWDLRNAGQRLLTR